MPIYNYFCPVCKAVVRKLLSPEEAEQRQECINGECAGFLTRHATGPSMAVKETVDNGIMAKRVEIFKDNTEVYKERNTKDYRNPDKSKFEED